MITPNTKRPMVNIDAVETKISKLFNEDGFYHIELMWHSYGGVKDEDLNYCRDYGNRVGRLYMDMENAERIAKDFVKCGYYATLERISWAYNAPTHIAISTKPIHGSNIYRRY